MSNIGQAELGLRGSVGKGDKDRSPGWRRHYDEINWGREKKIPLTQGKFAIVDAIDFDWLNRWKWRILSGRRGKFYVMRTAGTRSERKTILMHRLICGATEDEQVDHKNQDTLDNRRINLRLCTGSQNQWNRGASKNNTSGFKGVTRSKIFSKWRAQIQVFSRMINLGDFSSAAEASRAYKIAARKYHGEFSRT